MTAKPPPPPVRFLRLESAEDCVFYVFAHGERTLRARYSALRALHLELRRLDPAAARRLPPFPPRLLLRHA
eukprot:CAMPEP_0205865174 /NCGR_PEP_ID=MMETSP1083-20121108/7737_1 /ASSEMBLY_ACC=CAM_ASM_000430 /TAXON_ID=97485 /ORGANISM="Prymnesium parvum, Strain Texoma1" /LENGTH=70 /DNA_ID=CAMNT_0053227077 /DNA_START=275 /DNA_END=484 /DNA_ORIENTATION=+